MCTTIEDQAHLDDEIAALTLALSKLRSQRNALSPISRLPTEILVSIFIHCARSHQHPRYPGYRVPEWVNISHVCRHWRDVALNCSTLWSSLFVSSQYWTDQLLSRSKTAPLKVCMDSEYSKSSNELDLLRKVAHQADRIQDLCLRLTRQEAGRVLSLFLLPAPLLQNLQISVERSDYLDQPTELPKALFDGDTPALRKLELINYAFPLTRPALHGLTSLRLRELGVSFQPTLSELKVALSHMQDLSHLHLENALPSAHGDPPGQSLEDSEKLSFPQLSRLSIIAPFSTVVLLLSCFHFPLKTEVRLRCGLEANVDVDHTSIYPLLAKRFTVSEHEELSLVPITHTFFVETVLATVGFIFSTAKRDSGRRAFSASTTSYDLGQLHEDWDCNIPLKVDIVLRTSLSGDREDLVGGVCSSIPLTDLQTAHLSLDMGTVLSPAFWRRTFGHLQELRYIKLSGARMLGLVRVLSLAPHHGPKNMGGDWEEGSGLTFAPALKELELYRMEFSKKCYGRSQGNPNECSCSTPCLYDALSSRKAEGHGLWWLVFTECMYVRDYDVEGLRESVTDVNWDGVTRTNPDFESDDEAEGDVPRGHFGRTRFARPTPTDRWIV